MEQIRRVMRPTDVRYFPFFEHISAAVQAVC